MHAPLWIRSLLWLLGAAAGLYVLLVALLYFFQSTLIYFARQGAEPDLLASAESQGLKPWRNADREIIGWKSTASEQRPDGPPANRLLVFHGNAGYALNRAHFIRGFEQLDQGRRWEVYVFEYPGYGARPGAANEPSITRAASAAVEELKAADHRPLFILGESLGSGPACAMARDHGSELAGLLLVTPYSSLAAAAGYHYPWVPVGLLLHDHWANMAALRNYRGRFAARLAGQDHTTPTAQGRAIFEAMTGPKRLWIQVGAGHNTLNYALSSSWWQEASDFLTQS
jgi:hypothetical protein